MTIDGTDCPIWEPTPFSPRWYSHKFKGAGVRYEVGVCIQTGSIVWVNGAYPCGSWSDVKIFRHRLKHLLAPNELVEADKGYKWDDRCRNPDSYVSRSDQRASRRARARQETINHRLKVFNVLNRTYRHDRRKHQWCFVSCAVLVQMSINNNEKPWQVRY